MAMEGMSELGQPPVSPIGPGGPRIVRPERVPAATVSHGGRCRSMPVVGAGREPTLVG